MNKSTNIHIKNRKVYFDYLFIEDYHVGIQLIGTEVKAIRNGKISLVDSFCYFKSGELFLKGVNIAATEDAFTHDPLRERKLLLKRKELDKLERNLEKGMTIVVKRIYTNDRGLIKLEIALSKGKKNFDKRASIKERDIDRETKRELK
jgi:SsrA-binding protein